MLAQSFLSKLLKFSKSSRIVLVFALSVGQISFGQTPSQLQALLPADLKKESGGSVSRPDWPGAIQPKPKRVDRRCPSWPGAIQPNLDRVSRLPIPGKVDKRCPSWPGYRRTDSDQN